MSQYVAMYYTYFTIFNLSNYPSQKSLCVKFLMTGKIYLQRNISGNNSTSRKVVLKTSKNFYFKHFIKITSFSGIEMYKSKKSRMPSNYRFLIIKNQITVPSSCIQMWDDKETCFQNFFTLKLDKLNRK